MEVPSVKKIEDGEPTVGTLSHTINKQTSMASAISGVMADMR
jgi:hypothetical protein